MANGKGLLNTLYEEGVKVVERKVIAALQTSVYSDTATNLMAFGLSGGAILGEQCREWVFAETPGETANLIGTRNYHTSRGEKPLSNAGEINFAQDGRIAGYKSGETGKHPKSTYDKDAEELGILSGLTGGILPGKKGDVPEEGLQDLTAIRGIALDIAFNHYDKIGKKPSSKRKNIGRDQFGRNLYTVEIPVSESPFRIFNPNAYDPSLMGNYLKVASSYALLSPLYKPIMRVLQRAGFQTDPVIHSQLDAAQRFAETGLGDAALALYPVIATLYSAAKLGNEHLINGWNFGRNPSRT